MLREAFAMGVPKGGGAEGAGATLFGFVPVIVMFAIFYFLLIKPQQKKQKDRQAMIDHLKEGDNVVTQGGIYGSVAKIKDDVITLQIAENVRVKVTRASVSTLRAK